MAHDEKVVFNFNSFYVYFKESLRTFADMKFSGSVYLMKP